MKFLYILILVCCLAGCASQGVYFKEVDDGVQIKPIGKGFLFFKPKLLLGNYEYSCGDKKAKADFHKEPSKLVDINLSKLETK